VVTVETLTDDQIAGVLREADAAGNRQMAADCQLALTKRDRHWTRFERKRQRGAAQRICDAINADERKAGR
jgi:hypothetical protein